jgi:hypothetical protein
MTPLAKSKTVPEVAVHEHRNFRDVEYNVWGSSKVFPEQRVTKPSAV